MPRVLSIIRSRTLPLTEIVPVIEGLSNLSGLRHAPKIGNTVNITRLKAMRNFCDHISEMAQLEEELSKTHSDEIYGVYYEAQQQLKKTSAIIQTISAGIELSNEQSEAIYDLYRTAHKLAEDNNSDAVLPFDYAPQDMVEACNKIMHALDLDNDPEYLRWQQQQTANFTQQSWENIEEEVNFTQHQVTDSVVLVNMLRKALDFNEESNYRLTSAQIKLLQNALGKEQFDYFLTRYTLYKEKLTLDDVRMLVVGSVAKINTDTLQSPFIKHLCAALDIKARDSEERQFELVDKLSERFLKFSKKVPEALQRINQQPPTRLFDQLFNKARECLPIWTQFFVAKCVKANDAFIADLNLVTLTSNVKNWDREYDEQPKQRAAAHEYLFHGIAYQDLTEGTVVPVPEADGSGVQQYRIHKIVDEIGVRCIALVPVNVTHTPLDIKVMFTGTHDIGTAIVDTEKGGAGNSAYRLHEAKILDKLNSIASELVYTAQKQGNTTAQVSLTAGGHSLGGALTQNFAASMAKVGLHGLFQQYKDRPEELKAIAVPLIIKQINHEIDIGYEKKLKATDQIGIEVFAVKRFTQLQKTMDKHLRKQEPIEAQQAFRKAHGKKSTDMDRFVAMKTNNLENILSINIATLNAAGVARKTRDSFVDGLALLKYQEQNFNQDMTKIKFDQLMVGGDFVQQTGQANVAVAIPKEVVNSEVFKIDAGYEGVAKKNVFLAACQAMFRVITGVKLKIPLLNEDLGIVNAQSALIGAHTDFHFKDPNKVIKFKCLSNQNHNDLEELALKAPLVNNPYYQGFKKHASNFLKAVFAKISPVIEKITATREAIANKVEKTIKNSSVLEKINEAQKKLNVFEELPELNLEDNHTEPTKTRKRKTASLLEVRKQMLSAGEIMVNALNPVNMSAKLKGSWSLICDKVKVQFADNARWKITPVLSHDKNTTSAMIMAPKNGNNTYKKDNTITMMHDTKDEKVKFSLSSALAEDSTVQRMLDVARDIGDELIISGNNAELIAKAVNYAFEQNISMTLTAGARKIIEERQKDDADFNLAYKRSSVDPKMDNI